MKNKTLTLWALTGIALFTMGAEDSCGPDDILHDPTFDLWCGDTLCSWEVEAGGVAKVPTWHEAEDGAALRGDPTIISQLAQVGSSEVSCIQIDLLASVPAGSNLTLELDFYDDGYVEHSQALAGDDYSPVTYRITPPERWDGVRFRLRKTGEVDAIIAQIRALAAYSDDCSDPPLQLRNMPIGAPCAGPEECASGACAEIPIISSFDGGLLDEDTCGGCESDLDCPAGQACGLSWNEGWYGYTECMPAGEKLLGEACAGAGECASGTCEEGLCSECSPGGGQCEDGDLCYRHEATAQADESIMPFTCHGEPRAGGESCLADGDCASGSCSAGELLRICDPDGRPCDTNADCPYAELGGACVTVGPADGRCD